MSTPTLDPRLPNPYTDPDPAIQAQFAPGKFWARAWMRLYELFRNIELRLNSVISTAKYVIIGTDPNVPNGRALTAGANISVTDNGAGSTVVIAYVPPTAYFEQNETLAPANNAVQALNWLFGCSVVTHTGINALTFSNVPSSTYMATHTVYVDAFNNVTWPAAVTWGLGGIPSIAGAAWVSLVSRNGGTSVEAGIVWRAN